MDAGNLLKPMLGRGELRCIGATTLDEYRQYIEKDPALERRFQQACNPLAMPCQARLHAKNLRAWQFLVMMWLLPLLIAGSG